MPRAQGDAPSAVASSRPPAATGAISPTCPRWTTSPPGFCCRLRLCANWFVRLTLKRRARGRWARLGHAVPTVPDCALRRWPRDAGTLRTFTPEGKEEKPGLNSPSSLRQALWHLARDHQARGEIDHHAVVVAHRGCRYLALERRPHPAWLGAQRGDWAMAATRCGGSGRGCRIGRVASRQGLGHGDVRSNDVVNKLLVIARIWIADETAAQAARMPLP